MIVTFALQQDTDLINVVKRAKLAVASVRKYIPHARIIQLSDEYFPQIEGTDEVLRRPNKADFIRWAFESLIEVCELGEDVLQIATDVLIKEDVSDVFDLNFDVAACRYPGMDPNSGLKYKTAKFCGDVNFIKNGKGSLFIKQVLSIYNDNPKLQDGWEGGQTCFLHATIYTNCKIMELDFDTYCFTPESDNEDVGGAKILHFRGPRKQWMAEYATKYLDICNPEDAGMKRFELKLDVNTKDDDLFKNIKENSALSVPWVEEKPEHDGVALICGSGPSLYDTLDELILRQRAGGKIFALNNAAYALRQRGVNADCQVIVDARPQNLAFIEEMPITYLASQCHPELFRKVGERAILWHPLIDGIENVIDGDKPICTIGGGVTVGLSAMCLAYTLGYRNIHLFGYDTSSRPGRLHAISQFRDTKLAYVDVRAAGKWFKATQTMARQAQLFPEVANMLADLGCTISVHGDGLLPHIARSMAE